MENALKSGSLMSALVGGVTLTLVTSKTISFVARIKDLTLYCTNRVMFRIFDRNKSCFLTHYVLICELQVISVKVNT